MIEPILADEEFLADVEAANDRPGVHLWWLGQSGFLVNWQGHFCRRLLLDPYLSDSLTRKYAETDKPHVRMTRRVVDPARLTFIDLITASHAHTDHLDPDTLAAVRDAHLHSDVGIPPMLICPRGVRDVARQRWGADPDVVLDDHETWSRPDVRITGIAAAHEDVHRNEWGSCLYLGYVIGLGGTVVYHSGDTVLYPHLQDRLRPFNIDIALLPINGRAPERRVAGNLNGREAAWLAKEIGAKVVIPCHYEMFEFNTASPDEFVAECERLGQPYRVLRAGERFSSSELRPGAGS